MVIFHPLEKLDVFKLKYFVPRRASMKIGHSCATKSEHCLQPGKHFYFYIIVLQSKAQLSILFCVRYSLDQEY